MRKNIKYLILMIFMFMISLTCVEAKKIKISELDDEIIKVNSNPSYAYIIGDYIFTSGHKLTTQDIMLASRSIPNITDNDGKVGPDAKTNINASAIYDKMTITVIKPKKIAGTKQYTWVVDSNVAGTTELTNESEVNINYIDYNYVKDDTKATLDFDFNTSKNIQKYKELIETTYGFTGGNATNTKDLEYKDGKLTGLIKLFNGKLNGAGFSEEEMKGYYFSFFAEFENKELITEDSTISIKFLNNKGVEKAQNSKTFKKSSFDSDLGIAMLIAYNPDSEYKIIEVTLDYDGNKSENDKYTPYTYKIDLNELNVQKTTTASISIDESIIPYSDKLQLMTNWGYKFLNKINLSTDNTKHKKVELAYDTKSGNLTGTIFEQRLTGGFATKDLDSYFFTYTIKPEILTDNTKVTIKNGENTERIFYRSDFVEGVLTVLQHIPLENSDDKKITITIDSDGDSEVYLKSQEYVINYENIDFVKLHKVTINNTNKELISSIDVYDGEKLNEIETPSIKYIENYKYKYSTFDHWKVQNGEVPSESDLKFEFANGKSNIAIEKDITLYPSWNIDINNYIDDSLEAVNSNNTDLFKIEKSEENAYNVKILNRNTKLSAITDDSIATSIAHALASGEIANIKFALAGKEVEFTTTLNDEASIKEEVITKLNDFFKTKVVNDSNSDKTLSDLYDEWQNDSDNKLEVTVNPKNTVAKFSGLAEKETATYYVTIEKEFIVTFDAGILANPNNRYVEKNGNLNILPVPEIPESEQSYRTFEGWYDGGQLVASLRNINEDKTLVAHYKLNVDKFIEKVVADLNSTDTTNSNDYTDKFSLLKNAKNVTINVKKPNLLLSELADTSIPGTIAYVLGKGEIKTITLSVDSQNIDFTTSYHADNGKTYADNSKRNILDASGKALKSEIVKGAKGLFDEKLDNNESIITLDQLEYNNKSFTIMIGNVAENITLVNTQGTDITEKVNDKTYTFNFASNLVVVDQDDSLGEQNIASAISNPKGYSEIYIDGDYTSNGEIDIVTNHDIVIKPIEKPVGNPTIKIEAVGDDVNYAFDVSGTGKVTINDLIITGGKKAELRTEDDTNVIVNNIDVSGLTTPATKREEEIHSAIIVRGIFEANNVINSSESYALPTIALVKSYNLPLPDGSIIPNGPEENLGVNGTVKAIGMTEVNNYYIIKVNNDTNIDTIEERYSGKFYYNNKNNSKIYIMAIIDHYKSKYPYDYIKIYHYNAKINISNLGYKPGLKGETNDNFEFKNLTLSNDSQKEIRDDLYAQDVLEEGTTTMVVANYIQKTSHINLQQIEGLSYKNNNASGILTNQNNDGNYYIPITLTSKLFEENKSTVKVTNPNGESIIYTYNSKNDNGIATVSNEKTMKIDLEAIKGSKINNPNGKVYSIAIDVDGDENTYHEEIYTINYNDVQTLEELINNAAQRTQKATSLTMTKNNYIKGGKENFTYKYNKDNEITLYNENKSDVEYTFRLRNVVTDHNGPIIIVLRKNNESDGRPKLNDWTFANFLTEATRGTHEITLLQDVMKKTTLIEAINKVKKVEDHKYEVTLSKERLNEWLNSSYLDEKVESEKLTEDENTNVILEVTLDENDEYLLSMKTKSTFTIISNDKTTYNNNQIDVKYDNINNTIIETPIEFLSKDDKLLSIDDFKKFYEDCKKWHKLTTGSDIYEG